MSAAPLAEVESQFAVDSTGFSGARYLQWVDEKWGTPKRRATWVKIHAAVGVRTNVVVAASLPDRDTHDSVEFPGLVKKTAETFTIKEVSGDKAYCDQKCFAAVESVGGQFFPAFKKTATGKAGGAYAKAYHMFAMNAEEYGRHYHLRSNIESTFSAIKRRFGESLKSKTDRAMKAETLAKLVCHNICCLISAMYELGIVPLLGCTKNDAAAQVIAFPAG
jgi:transposase